MKGLSDDDARRLLYDWDFWAREKQRIPKGSWKYWLILAGRGFGKTRTGAETVRKWVYQGFKQFILVGATEADVRDTMITGLATGPEDGLLNVFPPAERPIYIPSKKIVKFHTRAVAKVFSAEKPNRLRGPQSMKVWADELCAWDINRQQDAWDNLEFGNRIGDEPQIVITTTPKPDKLLRTLVKDPGTHITSGTTYENKAFLAAKFLEHMLKKYEGTKRGRQELMAELLNEIEGTLWTRDLIDNWRVFRRPQHLSTVAVAIDPSTTEGDNADEAGIIGGGIDAAGHKFVLADRTMNGRPRKWASQAVKLYHELNADYIVAEANQGGLMVQEVIEAVDDKIKVVLVHATRGKRTRAEPISAEYEKGEWHHVGSLPQLEDEMCDWLPGQPSPNRMDALVWMGHALNGDIGEFGVTVV